MKVCLSKNIKYLSLCVLLISIFCMRVIEVKAATTSKANIYLGKSFEGVKFDAKDTIEIPFVVCKYSERDYGSYYCKIMQEDGTVVAESSGNLRELTVGITNLTVFWQYSTTPHKIGKYTIKYYTSNDEGGTSYFYVSTASGTCGRSITWTLDENGNLIISGSGQMDNYTDYDSPWFGQNKIIKNVEIGKGITSVGKSAFEKCYNIQSISLPETVSVLGEWCFSGCGNLTSIVIPEGVKMIPAWSFNGCSNLREITFPITLKTIDSEAFSECNISKVNYNGSKAMWKNIKNRAGIDSDVDVTCKIKNLKKVKIKSVKRSGNEIAIVKWQKTSGVNGYEIQCSEDLGSFNDSSAKKARVKGVKKTSKKFSVYSFYGYRFRVRSYKKVGSYTNYSDWSKIKRLPALN